ncbi:MAG: mevalonate kinase [Candidatus Methanomethylicia archaeon]
MVFAFAPAKVILFGEHFVVEDRLAIAAALDLKVIVKASFNDTNYIKIQTASQNIASLNIKISIDNLISGKFDYANNFFSPLFLILYNFSKSYPIKYGIDFLIESNIPIGVGLGSSAATFVAFSAALLKLFNYKFNLNDIVNLASQGESLAHGKPSGIDPTISTFGRIIVYRRSQGFHSLEEEFSKPIIIGISNVTRSTAEMVNKVLNLKKKHPYILDLLYETNDRIVNEAIDAIKSKNFIKLGDLMNIAHGLLSSIGVSNFHIENMIYAARNAGAYGAKITGAGGGGAIIALCDENNIEDVSNAILSVGGKVIHSKISNSGVEVYEDE